MAVEKALGALAADFVYKTHTTNPLLKGKS
jgi:hypothetical protein